MLTCKICGYQHPTMISSSHLKVHGISGPEYKLKFPGEVLRVQSQESKEKIKNSKAGMPSWNKGIKTGPNPALSAAVSGKERPGAKGKTRTAEQRQRIAAATRDAMQNVMTADVRQRLSDAIQKKKLDGTYVAPMLGKKHSAETRKKISEGQSGELNWARKKFEEKMQDICIRENLQLLKREKSGATGSTLFFTCLECGHDFSFCLGYFTLSQIRAGHAVDSNICPHCHPRIKNRSDKELELLQFITSRTDCEVISGSRAVIPPLELDIWIPSKRIAIEFNGIYWHCEEISKQSGVSKYRDYEKYLACKEQGIQLISIFEDEWDLQRQIVEDRLTQILGLQAQRTRVGARQCTISPIAKSQKDDFLNSYHIQRTDRAKTLLGAWYGDELVAVMTFSPTTFVKGGDGSETELSRFAIKSGWVIPGIASKLLAYYKKQHPGETIISYSDNRWSKGNVYEQLGFSRQKESKPGYFYINMKSSNKIRIHRSNFMKHRLEKIFKDPEVARLLQDGASEWEIMKHHGYDRIWDCGTTKWILE